MKLTFDQLYKNLVQQVQSGDLESARNSVDELRRRLQDEITGSERRHILRNIDEVLDGRKEAFILDYGCGGGRTVAYLTLLGFTNVYGVDLKSQDSNNTIMELLGVESTRCFQYDGTTLPFDNEIFDLVFSEQVLEHVHDIDGYYRESGRILKPGANAFFSFPHRYIPYDAHGNTWFVHMLPRPTTRFCYRVMGRDVDRLTDLLNFQTISYHKDVAMRYFDDVTNVASDRLRRFSPDDLQRYKGNRKLRKVIDRLVKSDILGRPVLLLIERFTIADLLMRKPAHVKS